MLVVVDHRVVVRRLPPAGLAETFRLGVGPEVHVGHVHPDEERGVGRGLALDEVDGRTGGLVVDRFHPLLGQWPSILDALFAQRAEPLVDFVGGLVGGPRLDDAPRPHRLAQPRSLLLGGVIRVLRFLLGVEVVQVAEELVETVRSRQILVEVAEVVLAELSGGVPQRLEQRRDRRVLGGHADVDARHTDFGQAGAIDALAGDERGAAGGAALLTVRVGEAHALGGDAVDVGGAIAHQSVAVATEVGDPDVVTPDDQDVGFSVRHVLCPAFGLVVGSRDRLEA